MSKINIVFVITSILLLGCTSHKFNRLEYANTIYELALESYNSVLYMDKKRMKTMDKEYQEYKNTMQRKMKKSAKINLCSAKDLVLSLSRDQLSLEDKNKYDVLNRKIDILNKKLN